MIRLVVSRFLSALALPLVLSLAVTPAASAQDGVQVDPNSPPAVEYALPLQEARGDAAPPRGGGSGAGGEGEGGGAGAPAFGSGITPKRSEAGARDDDRASGSQSGDGAAPESDPPAGATGTPAVRSGDVGSRATLYSVGGAAAVLLAGGLVGFALRRRQSSA